MPSTAVCASCTVARRGPTSRALSRSRANRSIGALSEGGDICGFGGLCRACGRAHRTTHPRLGVAQRRTPGHGQSSASIRPRPPGSPRSPVACRRSPRHICSPGTTTRPAPPRSAGYCAGRERGATQRGFVTFAHLRGACVWRSRINLSPLAGDRRYLDGLEAMRSSHAHGEAGFAARTRSPQPVLQQMTRTCRGRYTSRGVAPLAYRSPARRSAAAKQHQHRVSRSTSALAPEHGREDNDDRRASMT
jgi:hypothetical protein